MNSANPSLTHFANLIEHTVRSAKKNTATIRMPRYLRKSLNGTMLTDVNIMKQLNDALPEDMRIVRIDVAKCHGNLDKCPHYRKIKATIAKQPHPESPPNL